MQFYSVMHTRACTCALQISCTVAIGLDPLLVLFQRSLQLIRFATLTGLSLGSGHCIVLSACMRMRMLSTPRSVATFANSLQNIDTAS